ncbi:hypothetical protein JCM5296_004402, partial [Sporobolomyces johnsonii]
MLSDHDTRVKLNELIRLYETGVNYLVPTLEEVNSLLAEGPLRDSWTTFFEQSIEGTPTPPALPALSVTLPSDNSPPVQDPLPTPPTLPSSSSRLAKHPQKVMVLDYYYGPGMKNQTRTAAHFSVQPGWPKITQSTMSKWLSKEGEIREAALSLGPKAKRSRQVVYPDVEEALSLWCTQALSANVVLSGLLIIEKARDFARLLGPYDELDFSRGWLDKFKNRHGLRRFNFHGEASKMDATSVESERKRLCEVTKAYKLEDIWNMDETGLFYAMPPDSGLAQEGRHGVSSNKTRITLAFATSAAGQKRQMFVIGHARRPRSFQKKDGEDHGFYYRFNKKAWMTGELFVEWILRWNSDLVREGRHILLLLDNFAGHPRSIEGLTNITLEFLAPNMTSHIQPLDQGIIRAFKVHYHRLYIRHVLDQYEAGVTKIYGIDQLQAMRLAEEAWNDVAESTLVNCFRHAGIVAARGSLQEPSRPEGPLSDAASNLALARLKDHCDELEERNIVAASDRMSITYLCNPTPEGLPPECEFTDDEIVEEVRLRQEHRKGNIEEEDDIT